MRKPLVDPRLHILTMTHWPSVCNIQAHGVVQSESGQVLEGAGLPAVGIPANIPCSLAPITTQPSNTEIRTEGIESGHVVENLKLNGFFPLISIDMQAVVTDKYHRPRTYQILGVEADSQNWSTRLKVEIIIT